MRLSLELGTIAPAHLQVRMSGFRWLCADGARVEAGQPVAYCNIEVAARGARALGLEEFRSEFREFQCAIVLAVSGRIHRHAQASHGGLIDQLVMFLEWDPGFVIAEIEIDGEIRPRRLFRPLITAGRRIAEIAEVRTGLLSGWHNRQRAWWADSPRLDGTLLGLGTCDLTALLRGDTPGMLDLLGGLPENSQLIVVPDVLLVPCARTTLEQLQRPPEQNDAIAADMTSFLLAAEDRLTAADWIFAGELQRALLHAPLPDPCTVLLRGGLQPVDLPNAMVMSLLAEPQRVFRHRRLGYTMALHDFRIAEAGPGIRAWLRAAFEPVWRTAEDVRDDFRALLAALRGGPMQRLLLVNLYSNVASENITNYAPFDYPLGRTLASVWNKELNLALQDAAQDATPERALLIVDRDALAAEFGADIHLRDGIHATAVMQQVLQQEILRLLAANGFPGFQPALNSPRN